MEKMHLWQRINGGTPTTCKDMPFHALGNDLSLACCVGATRVSYLSIFGISIPMALILFSSSYSLYEKLDLITSPNTKGNC